MTEPDTIFCTDLGTHDGNTVAGAGVKIKLPGSVITATMDIAPVKIPQGTEVVVVLRGVVGLVSYPLVPKTDGLVTRVHTMEVTEMLIRDAEYASDELDAHRNAILVAQSAGDQGILDYPDDDDLYGELTT